MSAIAEKPAGPVKRTLRQIKRRVFSRGYLDRVVPGAEIGKLLAGLPLHQMDALEISGEAFGRYGFRSFRSAKFPEFDICTTQLPEQFDIIIAEQVFEHLLWPYRAARNVYAMLRPGGYFLLQTPFLLKVHNFPVDCSRWTEVGLRHFLAECGFQLDRIKAGSWGNRMAARANLVRKGFPLYHPLLHWNLDNDPLFPVQVWALAQK
jgi:SAM-dependent methyltransferase